MKQYLGKTLRNDVVNAFGVTILPAGTELLEDHLVLLENHKIDMTSLFFDLVEKGGQESSAPDSLMRKLAAQAKQMYNKIRETGEVPVAELEEQIVPAVLKVSRHPNIFELFEAVKAQDDYTYQHNIGVGIIATLIGRWLELSDDELSALSFAGTLHDVGKLKIPVEILNKPGKLTTEEYELVKKHAIYGYEILKYTEGVSYRTALVALQHHEREDGGGYPLGITSDKIDLFSKIVAVADIFHAMSSKRPYHDALPFYQIVRQMKEGYFGKLDPHIVSLFLENIMTKIVGQKVILTDGRIGEIVFINPHEAEAPLIKVDEEFIDLSSLRSVQIKQIIGI